VARLPAPIGDRLYHGLQQLKGLQASTATQLRLVERIQASCQWREEDWTGLRVVELGSGWFPVLPLLLASLGVARVDSYDINRHYSRRRIRTAARELLEHRRSCPLLSRVAAVGSLPGMVGYHPHTPLEQAPIPAASVDLAVSACVLEHVRPQVIASIQRAAQSWMADDGRWIHWVSPSDHRAYDDRRLCLVDFLRYSEHQWEKIAGNRFAYHNRLRLPQYRQLFEQTGWQLAQQEAYVDQRTIEALQALPIHPDFAGLAAEDLVAGALWFVLEKDDR
jgi:hypothetical protein